MTLRRGAPRRTCPSCLESLDKTRRVAYLRTPFPTQAASSGEQARQRPGGTRRKLSIYLACQFIGSAIIQRSAAQREETDTATRRAGFGGGRAGRGAALHRQVVIVLLYLRLPAIRQSIAVVNCPESDTTRRDSKNGSPGIPDGRAVLPF